MPHYELNGRVVVITGATGGLGSESLRLRRLGSNIMF
jgi:NAD(P)-dependent dehydrogenase (short-subunit alcohol dehydrogenase family)